MVEAEPGMTVMEAAVKNGVAGIAAECVGVACATATSMSTSRREKTGTPEQMEEDIDSPRRKAGEQALPDQGHRCA